jgi:hypothetical protein
MHRLFHVILFLTVATSVWCEQPASTATTSLVLKVEPSIRSKSDIRFRVVLENVGSPCRSLYVDPVISPFAIAGRARSQLVLALRDKSGRVLQPPVKRSSPVMLATRPEDLLQLECGMIVGRYIHLSQFGWDRLPPGRYQATATLFSHVASFVDSKPGYVDGLMRVSGDTRKKVTSRLVDAETTVSFAINVPNQ